MGEDVTPSGSPEQALLRWLEGGGPPQSQARPSRKGVEHPAGWGLEVEGEKDRDGLALKNGLAKSP